MKLNRTKVKNKLAAKHYGSIRRGIAAMYSVDQILDAWFALHREDAESQTTVTTVEARQWVRVNAHLQNTDKLDNALARLYADGWVLGTDIGLYRVAKALGVKKAPTAKQLTNAVGTNWNTWTPGNKSAAALTRPSGGLQKLLRQRGVKIQGMGQTTLDRIGTKLADGLAQGLTRKEIAKMLMSVVNDPERAVIIAGTEMSSAVVQSNLAIYKDAGVEMIQWLVSDPCDECDDNYNQSPIGIDEEWRSGDAPVHPNCECDEAPYVVDTGQWAEVYGLDE